MRGPGRSTRSSRDRRRRAPRAPRAARDQPGASRRDAGVRPALSAIEASTMTSGSSVDEPLEAERRARRRPSRHHVAPPARAEHLVGEARRARRPRRARARRRAATRGRAARARDGARRRRRSLASSRATTRAAPSACPVRAPSVDASIASISRERLRLGEAASAMPCASSVCVSVGPTGPRAPTTRSGCSARIASRSGSSAADGGQLAASGG